MSQNGLPQLPSANTTNDNDEVLGSEFAQSILTEFNQRLHSITSAINRDFSSRSFSGDGVSTQSASPSVVQSTTSTSGEIQSHALAIERDGGSNDGSRSQSFVSAREEPSSEQLSISGVSAERHRGSNESLGRAVRDQSMLAPSQERSPSRASAENRLADNQSMDLAEDRPQQQVPAPVRQDEANLTNVPHANSKRFTEYKPSAPQRLQDDSKDADGVSHDNRQRFSRTHTPVKIHQTFTRSNSEIGPSRISEREDPTVLEHQSAESSRRQSVATMAEPLPDLHGIVDEHRFVTRRRMNHLRSLQVVIVQTDQVLQAVEEAEREESLSSTGREAAPSIRDLEQQDDRVSLSLHVALLTAMRKVAFLGLAHAAAILPSIGAVSLLAKTWDSSLSNRSKEFRENLTTFANVVGLLGQTGSLLYSRLFPYTGEKPNKAADMGRAVMGIGLVFTYLAAHLTGTRDQATNQAARLLPFPLIRDFLLVCISKITNRNELNQDSVFNTVPIGAIYGFAQYLAAFGAAESGAYGGASLQAQLANWKSAINGIGKATALFGAVEALNLMVSSILTSKTDKFAPNENPSIEEVEQRRRNGPSQSLRAAATNLDVVVGLKVPTSVDLLDQYSGTAITNFNFFMIGINLTGVIANIAQKISQSSKLQNQVTDMLYGVVYGVFCIPFAMALMQNPHNRWKYAEDSFWAKTLLKSRQAQERCDTATPPLGPFIP